MKSPKTSNFLTLSSKATSKPMIQVSYSAVLLVYSNCNQTEKRILLPIWANYYCSNPISRYIYYFIKIKCPPLTIPRLLIIKPGNFLIFTSKEHLTGFNFNEYFHNLSNNFLNIYTWSSSTLDLANISFT